MKFLNLFKKYIGIYRELFVCSLVESTGFRANFLFLFILGCVAQGGVFFGISMIYERISHVGVWDRDTFFFFAAYMIVVLELHNTFITRNYWEMYDLIVKGSFDFFLLKPLHPIFLTFFRYCRIANFLLLPIPIAALIYFGSEVGLSIMDWILLPVLLFVSFSLVTLLGMFMCCFVFWSYQGAGINFVRIQSQEMASWPDYLFFSTWRFIFSYIFPILLIGSAPVRFLLNSDDWHPLTIMLGECALLIFAIKYVWKRALIQYESASS